MAKTKTPFYSFGSKGSIADALTSQRHTGETIIRAKPKPAYRYSLAQAYQRWLYEDYVYLWHQQSQATKDTYRSAGVRHHLTAFQYWMKYNLTNLPDICGWWKLDDNLGATTFDSSKHNNPGTILGASPATGPIDRCLSYDGLNDETRFGTQSWSSITDSWTLETFINTTRAAQTWLTCNAYAIPAGSAYLLFGMLAGRVQIASRDATNAELGGAAAPAPSNDGLLHYVAAFRQPGIIGVNVDGISSTLVDNRLGHFNYTSDFRAGWKKWWGWYIGILDNIVLYNRRLSDTELLRHSLRRYPP